MDRIRAGLVIFKKMKTVKKYIKIATNYNVSLYPICLVGEMLFYDFHKLAGKDFAKGLAVFKNRVNSWYFIPGSRDKIAKIIFNKIKNKNWVKRNLENIHKTSRELENYSAGINKLNLQSKTDQELLGLYERYNELFKKMYLFGWLPNAAEGDSSLFSKKLERIIFDKLKKINRINKLGEYFSILGAEEKDSERDKEREDLLKIVKSGKNFETNIKKHHKKYCWLYYDYDGPALTLDYFIKEAKKIKKNGAKTGLELEMLKKKRAGIKAKRKKIERELGLSPAERDLYALAREFSFIKNYRKDILYKSYCQTEKLLKKLGERLNLNLIQVKHILPREMKPFLDGGKALQKILNERIKYSVLAYEKNPKVYIGQEAKKIIVENTGIPMPVQVRNELKGQSACAGLAQGRVRIVNTPKDMAGFKKGEILISEKTNPNLIPAMKLAAAIVTNIGGLTCHAAIVSRELNKPCVVGTKIATQIFKDGDLVEVDANAGVVRLIR
ncbi:MAG: PEP-utilizing enzyme [Patescibacteria group bacterium]